MVINEQGKILINRINDRNTTDLACFSGGAYLFLVREERQAEPEATGRIPGVWGTSASVRVPPTDGPPVRVIP